MTSVRDNNLYKCGGCDQMFTIDDPRALETPCPKCGVKGKVQIPLVHVCDFCSTPLGETVWTYPAEDFPYTVQLPGMGAHSSAGDWAACDECHDLIEGDLREALAVRSLSGDIDRAGESAEGLKPMLYAIIKQMQDDFFNHRTGDAYQETIAEHYGKEGG